MLCDPNKSGRYFFSCMRLPVSNRPSHSITENKLKRKLCRREEKIQTRRKSIAGSNVSEWKTGKILFGVEMRREKKRREKVSLWMEDDNEGIRVMLRLVSFGLPINWGWLMSLRWKNFSEKFKRFEDIWNLKITVQQFQGISLSCFERFFCYFFEEDLTILN